GQLEPPPQQHLQPHLQQPQQNQQQSQQQQQFWPSNPLLEDFESQLSEIALSSSFWQSFLLPLQPQQQQQELPPPPPFYQSSSTLDFTGTAEQLQSLSNCYTLLHEASNSRSATSSSTSNDNMQRRRSNSRRYAQHRQMIPSPPPLQPSASAFASEMPHHGSTASHLGYQQQQQQDSNAPMLAALMAANAQSNLLNPSPLDHQPPPPAHQQPQQHQRRQPGVPTALQNAATANGGLFTHLKVSTASEQHHNLRSHAGSSSSSQQQNNLRRHHQQQQQRQASSNNQASSSHSLHHHQQRQQHQQTSNPALMACLNGAGGGGIGRADSTVGAVHHRKRSGDFSFPTFDSSSAQSVSSSIFGGAASIVDEFLSGCSSSSFSHHNHHHQHHHHHHHHSSPSSARPDSVLPEELPFFEHLNTLLKPTLLRPSRSNGHNQYQQQAHCDLEFGMNPQQVKSVLSMRTRDLASGRTEYAVQVLIRCFHSEAGTQPDAFPPGVNLTVNSQPVLGLPAPLPCRPGSDPVRPGRPVNISGLCRLSASSQANNRIRVSWLHRPSGPGYCLSVSLARVVSSNDLANRLLTLPGRVRPASQTQRQIRQLLLGNGDDDEDDDDAMVAMTTITASLRCPLSCARIQLPVRSDDCRHVQCFDARTYLSMNERRATWRCPCCDRPAPYASLHVDAHFQSVLANAPKSVDVVRFLDDGTWQPAGANAASSSTSASTAASASTYKGSSSALRGANFDSVVIDDDDDDDNSYSAIDEAPPTLKRQKRSDSVDDSPSTICNDLDPGDVIVVDLTADSDSGGDGNGRDCDDSSDSQSDTDTYNNGYGCAYSSGAVGVIVTPVQSPSPSPPIQPSSHGGGASSSSNSSSSAAAAAPVSVSTTSSINGSSHSFPLSQDLPTYFGSYPTLPIHSSAMPPPPPPPPLPMAAPSLSSSAAMFPFD
ncbi:hypothetical protein BOX15_Mlig006377g1, partial [Macrostomum lignano]